MIAINFRNTNIMVADTGSQLGMRDLGLDFDISIIILWHWSTGRKDAVKHFFFLYHFASPFVVVTDMPVRFKHVFHFFNGILVLYSLGLLYRKGIENLF